ncbi:Gustatory receptor [Sergentomyia squamirostris]
MWSVVCFNLAVRCLYAISKCMGLAPIIINFENVTVHAANRYTSLLPTVLLLPILLILYPISWYSVSSSFHDSTSASTGVVEQHTYTGSTANMNGISWMVQYVAGYVILLMISIMQIGHRRRENTVKFLRDTVTLYHKLPSILPNIVTNYQEQRQPLSEVPHCKNLLVLFLLKSVLFEMVLIIATWFNLNSHFVATNTSSAFLHSLIAIFPSILLSILSNTFYGITLLYGLALNLLNRKLLRIREKLSTMLYYRDTDDTDGIHGHRHRKLTFHHYQLHFSDQIDEIAILYAEIAENIKMLHQYTSLPVLLIITHSFLNIIIELFLIYLALTNGTPSINYPHIPMEFIFVLLNYLQIFFVIQASMTIEKQVESSISVLSAFQIGRMENRLEKSVRNM